jgi:predicted transcriptional regulator
MTALKYRSKTEIVSSILDAANGGVTKTKIMYMAFLSYSQLKEYLAVLTESGLLIQEPESQRFRTTAKGLQFLTLNNQMGQLLSGQTEKELVSKSR